VCGVKLTASAPQTVSFSSLQSYFTFTFTHYASLFTSSADSLVPNQLDRHSLS